MLDKILLTLSLTHGAGLVVTDIGLSQDHLKEANPLMQNRAIRYSLKAGLCGAQYGIIKSTCKTKRCKILMTGLATGINGFILYKDIRKLR